MSDFFICVVTLIQCVGSEWYTERYIPLPKLHSTRFSLDPQDMLPYLSDEMGISHYCEQPAVSGVQKCFNREYVPSDFPLLLFKQRL